MLHAPRRSAVTTRLVVATITLLLTLAASGVAVSAAGAATPGASATPVTKVTIKAYKFLPSKFTVTVGVPVTVKNKDGATHNLAAVNGAFKTKYIEGGASGKFVVKKPGTYKIVCTLHPEMTGTITAT